MTKALVIIDIQNDYFPGGKIELVGAEAAALNAAKLQSYFRKQGWPVINVQHIARSETATFFLPDTFGAEIHQDVAPLADEAVIVKYYPNSFRDTSLGSVLEQLGVTDLVVAGMMTHMCIDTTVRAANDLGFNVTLAGDACATKDLEFDGATVLARDVQTSYLAAIEGSFASVVPADSILEH